MRRLVMLLAVAITTLSTGALSGCGPETPGEGEGEEGEGEGEEGEGEEGEGEEGEGEEGEGEGEGDAGEGEGEGEGDAGGEGEGEAPVCVEDGDCDLGFLCDSGDCVIGCTDSRDCPDNLVCNVALGDNGRCVACVDATDCANGDVCDDSQCRQGCVVDGDCDVGVCDTANDVCVDCNEDGDCDAGTICTDQHCVLGCRDDRDCAGGETCGAAGLCVEACVDNGDCANNSTCVDSVCALGCAGDDANCGFGQVCGPNDRCAQRCNNDDNCPTDFVCDAGACVPGDHPACVVDDDCGGNFSPTPFCSAGVCVGCNEDVDCDRFGDFGLTCFDDHTCRSPCNDDGTCPRGPTGGVCLTGGDSCVDCNDDVDCGVGEACANNVCVVVVADDPLCSDCEQADDVCGAGNLCVVRQIADNVRESACGIDCSDGGACPQAFTCELVVRQGTAVGAQCVPSSRVVPAQTCVAVRDAQADEACVTDDDCGANNVDDGACVDGVCSLPCAVEADCFAGESCAPVIGSDVNACQ